MIDIYIARDMDGFVWSYSDRPEWDDAIQMWVGRYIGGYQGSEKWPESFLPRGMMGLAKLDLVDRNTVPTAFAMSAVTVDASMPTRCERVGTTR